MKKKKTCYKCNKKRYLRGFAGKGKRRNSICNLCLKQDMRSLIYLDHDLFDLLPEK